MTYTIQKLDAILLILLFEKKHNLNSTFLYLSTDYEVYMHLCLTILVTLSCHSSK